MLEKVSQFFPSLGEKRGWKVCGYAIKNLAPAHQKREKILVLPRVAFSKLSDSAVVTTMQEPRQTNDPVCNTGLGGDFLARFPEEGCWYGKCRLELARHTYLHATA